MDCKVRVSVRYHQYLMTRQTVGTLAPHTHSHIQHVPHKERQKSEEIYDDLSQDCISQMNI